MNARGLTLTTLICALVLTVGGGAAQAATSFGVIGEFGTPGAGDGEFGESSPRGIAVDGAGDVWVTDGHNARVEKFGASLSGEFLLTLGWGVQNHEAPEFQICTSLCSEGISGAGEGQFSNNLGGFLALPDAGVAVAPVSGDVFVADTANNRIEEFASSGSPLSQFNGNAAPKGFDLPTGLAIAPTTDDVYVMDSEHNVVDRFSATGTYECQISGEATTSQCSAEDSKTPQEGLATGSERTSGLAVDASGDLYVADHGHGVVDEFDPAGTYVTQFSAASPTVVAVDSVGNVFVSEEGSRVTEFDPSGTRLAEFGAPEIGRAAALATSGSGSSERVYVADESNSKVWIFGPVVTPTCATGTPPSSSPATSATVPGTINPEGIKASYHFEYGTSESYGATSVEVSSWDGDEGTEPKEVSEDLTGLQPHQTYNYQLVASNPHGTSLCGNQTLETAAARPSIVGQSTTGITQNEATLQAQINPNNEATHWHFEYGTNAALVGAKVSPEPEGEMAAGYDASGNAVEAAALSLQPNTTYYYRIVASNAGGGASEGSIESFVTRPATPTTEAATHVSDEEAALDGSFNSGIQPTRYYFEYGTTACTSLCGTSTTIQGPASGVSEVRPTVVVTALSPFTTYHYRVVVENAAGPTYGTEREFTTLPEAPAVITNPASSTTGSSAVLAGEVVPQCVEGHYPPTTYRFEYGTTTAYGPASDELAVIASSCATGGEAVAASIAGLLPSTIYHYRLDAKNGGGETVGQDQIFVTNAAGEPDSSPVPPGFALTGSAPTGPTAAVFPNLTTLAPISARVIMRAKAGKPRAPSCEYKARKITKANKRRAALKRCAKAKRGKVGR
jgi:phosphodiesterase/alkaline phosphatase D-like protein